MRPNDYPPGTDEVRTRSRRHEPKVYRPERLPRLMTHERKFESAPFGVAQLNAAGKAGSALRRTLKEQGIDPKLARLVLCIYEYRRIRVGELAWVLGVHPSTASRHLDRAESAALVDKFYSSHDRRTTAARLTDRGRDLRHCVERLLAAAAPYGRPSGYGYGRRAMRDAELD